MGGERGVRHRAPDRQDGGRRWRCAGPRGREGASGHRAVQGAVGGLPAGDRHVGGGRSDPVWRGGLC